jgi:hypothetical protein
METEYVKNPETNRYIKVGGPTYQKLKDIYHLQTAEKYKKPAPSQRHASHVISEETVQEMLKMPVHQYDLEASVPYTTRPSLVRNLQAQIPKKSEGRGSRTRGWSADAPQRGLDRQFLRDQCGNKCFLIPETYGFPICPRCVDGHCKCQIDCRGLAAAKIRAHQHKYEHLYDAIERLESAKCKKN